MNYDKFIKILEEDKIKIIPILENEDCLDDINFTPSYIEYIYRRDNCEEEIQRIKDRVINENRAEFAVGTILNKKEADFCIKNDIKVLFSPHFDPELVKYCLSQGVIMIPGVSTSTEIMAAFNIGVKVMKFFPCHCQSNIEAIGQYSTIFNRLNIKFTVSGGVKQENYKEILNIKNVIAVGSRTIKPYK
tara:strand:- start:1927 stop:2493 length:567 start_codon:yes stop_codon:yes gene_type:complete